VAAGPPAWWKTALASIFGAVLGIFVGPVAVVLVLLLVSILLGMHGGAGVPGMGAAVILVVFLGAAIGFLVGLALPWIWRARTLRKQGKMLSMGVARAPVAHAALRIPTTNSASVPGTDSRVRNRDRVSALGCDRTALARKETTYRMVFTGAFVGAAVGMALWLLGWTWGLLFGWEMELRIIVFATYGAAIGIMLGFVMSLIWRGWKRLTTARQRSSDEGSSNNA
jgi:hypothetical protein